MGEGWFQDQERMIPRIPEIPEEFPARKSLISDILGFPASDGDHLLDSFLNSKFIVPEGGI